MAVDDINQLNLNEVLEMIKKDESDGNDTDFPGTHNHASGFGVMVNIHGADSWIKVSLRRESEVDRQALVVIRCGSRRAHAALSSSRSRITPRQRRRFLVTVSSVASL